MTEVYQFEELDHATREYLVLAKEGQGKGMPGIYSGKTDFVPIVGMVLGFCIIIATLLVTFPPTDPPTKEACLQTAGYLLGGWMVIAALRVWFSGKSGKYGGHFVYADADNLFVGKGGIVEVIGLESLREARATQNFNEGKYQNTILTVKTGHERQSIQVNDKERGRRLAVFLNALSYMRGGGEDGNDESLKKLSPETMGAVAKQVARTGEFPKILTATEEADVARVPRPRREGRRSTGLLPMFLTIVAGTAMFFGFRAINPNLRDQAVFDQIKALPPKEQPPALRLYLSNPEFTAHRDEAQQLLDTYYDNGVRGFVKGEDEEMKRGLSEVVLALKNKPAPVVTLIVAQEESPAGFDVSASTREKSVQTLLADKFGSTIGDELVAFVAPSDPDKPDSTDKKSKGMIDVRWKFQADGSLNYRVEFRKSPDEEAFVGKDFTVPANKPAPNAIVQLDQMDTAKAALDSMAAQILKMTVGETRIRPMPPPEQLDF